MPKTSDFKCNHCEEEFELFKPDGGEFSDSCPSCGSKDIQVVYRKGPGFKIKGYSYKNGYSGGKSR